MNIILGIGPNIKKLEHNIVAPVAHMEAKIVEAKKALGPGASTSEIIDHVTGNESKSTPYLMYAALAAGAYLMFK